MSHPSHRSYQDSGTKWLGAVPDHWELKRLAHYFDERRTKVSDKDYPPLSVTKSGVVPQLETAAKTDDGDNRKLVLAGDLVINSRSDRKGSSGLSELDGSVSLINTVLDPTSEINGRFAHHLLRSIAFQEEYYRFGKGIVADLWSTNFSEMRNILLAVPPLPEQASVATFLNRETAKIDALVEEQRRLIELLEEKRQTVISDAVTKGLDPTVPMKNSGVEWLGEVPVHWEVSRLGYLAEIVSGFPFDSALFQEDGIPVIRMSDFAAGALKLEAVKRVSPEYAPDHSLARANDILIGLSGSISNFAVVKEGDLPVAVNQRVAIARARERFENAVQWFLQSEPFLRQIEANLPATTIQNVSMQQLRACRVPTAPSSENFAINRYLETETSKIDLLVGEVRTATALLAERRAALVSAAVTGKIDVRGVVAVQPDAEAA